MNNLSMVNFHSHSSWSFEDAILDVKEYPKLAKMLNAKSIGISEHNNLCSWLEFQESCKKADIKPIAAVEWYFYWSEDANNRKSNHLLTVAYNEQGYRNLLKLMALSNTPLAQGGGFFYRPRISEKMLYAHKEGLLLGSACLSSPVTSQLIAGNETNARIAIDEFKREFGDKFFIEIFPHMGLQIQVDMNLKLMQIAKEMDVNCVVSLDAHFKDASYEEIYLINGRNRRRLSQTQIENPETDCLRQADFYFKDCDCIVDSLEQHGLARKDIFAAMDHSVQLDKIINFEYKDHFEIPAFCENPDKALEALLSKKLIEKFGSREKIRSDYAQRLRYEYTITVDKSFSSYFLILEDAISWCRKKGYNIGVGRGSAGGCLMAYILGITNVDPILYNLPFERFLNPFRSSAPDIDVDIDSNARKELIDYLKVRWGEKNVVQIITFGEVKSKVAIKDVAKYLEIPFKEVNAITAAIPSMDYDNDGVLADVPLKDALEIPAVKKYQKENKKLFDLALQLEGSYKSYGVHAGGVIILPKPADEIIPIMHKKGEDGADVPISAWDKKMVEKIGLVKYDFLGLSTLKVLKECENLTGVALKDIPLDDKKTWEYFQNAKHMKAVFQFTEPKTCKYLRDSKPSNIIELSNVNTGIRPGSDWATYIANKKKNKVKPKFDLPIVRDTLKETFGAILYQDDLLFLISNLSEFNLGEADLFRRALEKNNKDEIEKYKSKFIETCVYQPEAEEIFNWLKESCGYLFAKAHAVAYSINGYYCAYYKANFPAEFMVANMRNPKSSAKQSESEYIADFVKEAKEMGIKVHLPKLGDAYTITSIASDGGISYGILGIKGIGEVAASALADIKAEGFDDFVEKALNIKKDYWNGEKKQTRCIITKAHIKSLTKLGFFGLPETYLPKYNDRFKENEDLGDSFEESVNDALGFEYYSPLLKYIENLDPRYKTNDEYLVVQIKEVRKGSKNGRDWCLIKGISSQGAFSAFYDKLGKNDIALVKIAPSNGDTIKIINHKLLR